MEEKKLPSYRDSWFSSDVLRDQYISGAISRARLTWLHSNLYWNDTNLQLKSNYTNFDKQTQALDESIIFFKRRSSLRQYMPNKPTKRGYKIWVRTDSSEFMCEF